MTIVKDEILKTTIGRGLLYITMSLLKQRYYFKIDTINNKKDYQKM